jgi:hypothetical protein
MPVDYTGLVIAIAMWLGGTVWTYRRICAAQAGRPESARGILTSLGVTLVWTAGVSALLAAFGVFVIWFYDWLHGRA